MNAICLILPAAGEGRRFAASSKTSNHPVNKVEVQLAGRPIFLRAIESFKHRQDVVEIILAVPPDSIDQFKFKYGDRLGVYGVKVVPGGKAQRCDTVRHALDTVDPMCTHVAVHDAARPLATTSLIDRVFAAAERHAAVVPAVAVTNTLKRVRRINSAANGDEKAKPLDAILNSTDKTLVATRLVEQTIDRTNLVAVQTPQVFKADLLRRAYAQYACSGLDTTKFTDEAGLVESLGEPVHVIDGNVTNLKITRSDDLQIAEALLAAM